MRKSLALSGLERVEWVCHLQISQRSSPRYYPSANRFLGLSLSWSNENSAELFGI
jgi:hypothetical protein